MPLDEDTNKLSNFKKLGFIEGDEQNGVADGVRKTSNSLFANFLIKRNRQSNLDYARELQGMEIW